MVPVFSQTYSKMDLWVDRIPVSDSSLAPQCLRQNVMLYVDPMRIGIVSETDTVALVVNNQIRINKLYCTDMVSGDKYIYESYVANDGFIFFMTPDARYGKPKSKYSLIFSTLPCEK